MGASTYYVIAAIAAVYGASEQHKASKAQKRARSEAEAGHAQEQAQERRQQIREQRIRQAQILQRSEAAGTGESSGEVGALGSLSTNTSTAIAANLGRAQVSRNISMFEQQAADALSNAATAQAVGSLAMSYGGTQKKPSKTTTPDLG